MIKHCRSQFYAKVRKESGEDYEPDLLSHASSLGATFKVKIVPEINFILQGPLRSHPQFLAMCTATTSTIAASHCQVENAGPGSRGAGSRGVENAGSARARDQ